ncbi:MAG: hypothetical protein KIY12_08260 [Thermoplasmata archaeon]|uniref:Translin family protein n=1 Tax=Candidatus Sysuiplasma superficiale TaxID=2823368 RepID=A0A8J8CEK1_9ARCH|nr:hypothetical protein [Candidatus Sysuiplasma superficiale]MBX8644697.1 hypothetical protein [Candidatus Sysuiplasma superficiale]
MVLVNLENVMTEVEKELDERDEIREIAIRKSREIVRNSSDLIYRLHREAEGKDIVEGFRKLKADVMELLTLLEGNSEIYYSGFVEDALQEYVEATLFRCAVTGREMPTHLQMKVDASTYVMGLSDLIGELRRSALDRMLEGNVEAAGRWVEDMDRLFLAISRLHYPSKLTQIRKKQDSARAMLDRTMGELTAAKASHALSGFGKKRKGV